MWSIYEVKLSFYHLLCASVPADPELIKKWLESRQPKVRPAGGKSIAEIQEEVFETLAEQEPEEEKNLLIFQRTHGILVERAHTIRAHIKDCARVLSAQYVGRIEGERAFSTRVINGVYLDEREYWLPILDADGKPVTEPTSIKEKPVRFKTRTGQQLSALKAFECIKEPRLEFMLKVLGDSVKLEDLETIFRYGGVHGYGGERGDGEGRYSFEITLKEQANGTGATKSKSKK